MKLPLLPHDIPTGTWARVRAGLVGSLWAARMQLEGELTEVETARVRERIRFVKELLGNDPKKDDYDLRPRAVARVGAEVLAEAFELPPEETVAEDLPATNSLL
jgi:hypothetical protein